MSSKEMESNGGVQPAIEPPDEATSFYVIDDDVLRDYTITNVNRSSMLKTAAGRGCKSLDSHLSHRPKCIMCKEPVMKRCPRCKKANYCSLECRKADQKVHDWFCQSLAEYRLQSRPGPSHVRVIYFPYERDRAELAWMNPDAKPEPRLDRRGAPSMVLRALTYNTRKPHYIHKPTNCDGEIIHWGVGHHLGMAWTRLADLESMAPCVHNYATQYGPYFNRSMTALGRPGYVNLGVGSFAIYAFTVKCPRDKTPALVDLDLADIRTAVDILQGPTAASCAPAAPRSPMPALWGVKINDLDDGFVRATGVVKAVERVRTWHRTWNEHVPALSVAAIQHGLRWYLRKADPAHRLAVTQGTTVVPMSLRETPFAQSPIDPRRLRRVFFLWPCSDSNAYARCYGILTAAWQREYGWDERVRQAFVMETNLLCSGSVIVIHGGGAPLHPAHVEAFAQYLAAVQDAQEHVAPGKVVASRGLFEAYWYRWKERQVRDKGRADLVYLRSPYDLEDNKAYANDVYDRHFEVLKQKLIEERQITEA